MAQGESLGVAQDEESDEALGVAEDWESDEALGVGQDEELDVVLDVGRDEALDMVSDVQRSYTYHVYHNDFVLIVQSPSKYYELHQNTYGAGHGNVHGYDDKLCIENFDGGNFLLFLMEALYMHSLRFDNMDLDNFV